MDVFVHLTLFLEGKSTAIRTQQKFKRLFRPKTGDLKKKKKKKEKVLIPKM